jgi:hypothetical protein
LFWTILRDKKVCRVALCVFVHNIILATMLLLKNLKAQRLFTVIVGVSWDSIEER